MRLRALTIAFVLTPCAVSFAADPPGQKAPGLRQVPAVQTARAAAIVGVEGIAGERSDGRIDALTISGNCAPAAAGHEIVSPRDAASGMATGKRQHKPFVITHHVDKASPLLAQAAASGKVIPKVRIEQGGGTIELEHVLIGLLKTGGGDRPVETVTLNFAKCTRK